MTGERPDTEGSEADVNPVQSVAIGAVTFLTLGVAFGLMALNVSYFWVAFPVGFGGGIPLAAGLARWYESRPDESGHRPDESDADSDAALADLRERYARGELDEAEFEARVERLLETESVDDAKNFAERTTERPATGHQEPGSETARVDDERERA